MKKIMALVLMSIMLLGMTLTANAAPSIPQCPNCGRQGTVVLQRTLYENGKPYLYEWWCQYPYCYNHWTTYAH